jgi:hypothetical protein
MKSKMFSLVLLVAAFSVSKMGYTQQKDLTGVTAIDINIACQLVLVQGKNPNMEIVGDKRAIKDIRTSISNGKLMITSNDFFESNDTDDVVVKIEVADLKQLRIGGVVEMKTLRNLEFPDFEMSISGVGTIQMGIISKNFRLKCSGVGSVELQGQCDELRMDVSGVGNVNSTKLIAKNARVTNSGVGRVSVCAEGNLDASVSGIGSIRYTGKPILQANVSGLGSIGRF